MEQSKEARKLAARLDNKVAEGLLDVKFYVRNPGSVDTETVFREVNNLYQAIEDGKCEKLDFKDKSH